MVVDTYYQKEKNLNTWHGFNVFAVDGTSLEIPCTDENINHFGAYSNQSKTLTSKASASILYDVLNDIIVDSIIGECHASERKQAIEHVNSVCYKNLLKNSIITFDRGYPSDELFNILIEKELFFLCRLSSSYNITKLDLPDDSIIKYHQKKTALELRVIKVTLSDGTIETLVTNILDQSVTLAMFKELYFLRWGIETKYNELKNSLEIEEFSGKKPIIIEQDFYASIYISIITSIMKKDVDLVIQSEQKQKSLKYKYQGNRNFILTQIIGKLILLLIYPRKHTSILKSILEKSKRIRSHIRTERSVERKIKYPRKTHHSNMKACL